MRRKLYLSTEDVIAHLIHAIVVHPDVARLPLHIILEACQLASELGDPRAFVILAHETKAPGTWERYITQRLAKPSREDKERAAQEAEASERLRQWAEEQRRAKEAEEESKLRAEAEQNDGVRPEVDHAAHS